MKDWIQSIKTYRTIFKKHLNAYEQQNDGRRYGVLDFRARLGLFKTLTVFIQQQKQNKGEN